jgi:hypothetical protein
MILGGQWSDRRVDCGGGLILFEGTCGNQCPRNVSLDCVTLKCSCAYFHNVCRDDRCCKESAIGFVDMLPEN